MENLRLVIILQFLFDFRLDEAFSSLSLKKKKPKFDK